MIFHRSPPLLRTLITMILGAFAIIALFVLLIDQVCHMDITSRQMMYPDAEIVSQEFDLWRPRALGYTTLVLQTDEDEETLRQWLRERNLELLRAERFRGLAALNWGVHPPREGVPEGRLVYVSSCGV
ncbi:MAG: hypothetical protein OXB89_09400 [Anaerolineaceae bacterium]|nr:hypothetical protein [Anaerolineaceae bacterium]